MLGNWANILARGCSFKHKTFKLEADSLASSMDVLVNNWVWLSGCVEHPLATNLHEENPLPVKAESYAGQNKRPNVIFFR